MRRKGLLICIALLILPILALAYPAPRPQELPQKAQGYLGLDVWVDDDNTEVLILSVRHESPAERAGLQRHDVIVEIDGRPIDDPHQILARILSCRPGSVVPITVVRGKEFYTVFASTGHRTANMTDKETDQLFAGDIRQTGVVEGVGEEFLQ